MKNINAYSTLSYMTFVLDGSIEDKRAREIARWALLSSSGQVESVTVSGDTDRKRHQAYSAQNYAGEYFRLSVQRKEEHAGRCPFGLHG